MHRRNRTTCPVQGLCIDPLSFVLLSSAALDFYSVMLGWTLPVRRVNNFK